MIRVFTSLLEIIRYGFESVVVPECTHELPIKTVQDCTELSQLLVAGKKVIDFHRPFAKANRKAYRKLVGVQVFILFFSSHCSFRRTRENPKKGLQTLLLESGRSPRCRLPALLFATRIGRPLPPPRHRSISRTVQSHGNCDAEDRTTSSTRRFPSTGPISS